MVNCQSIQNELIFYLEENIPQEKSILIENHLHSCDSCRGIYNEIKSTYQIIDEVKQFDVKDDFTEKVLLDFDNFIQPSRKISYTIKQILAYAAVVSIGIFIGALTGSMLSNNSDNGLTEANSDLNYWNDFDHEPLESFFVID